MKSSHQRSRISTLTKKPCSELDPTKSVRSSGPLQLHVWGEFALWHVNCFGSFHVPACRFLFKAVLSDVVLRESLSLSNSYPV
jgi:hypothetical protein